MARLFTNLGRVGLALAVTGGVVQSALYNGNLYSNKIEFARELAGRLTAISRSLLRLSPIV